MSAPSNMRIDWNNRWQKSFANSNALYKFKGLLSDSFYRYRNWGPGKGPTQVHTAQISWHRLVLFLLFHSPAWNSTKMRSSKLYHHLAGKDVHCGKMFLVAIHSFNEYWQVPSGKDAVTNNIVKVSALMKHIMWWGEVNNKWTDKLECDTCYEWNKHDPAVAVLVIACLDLSSWEFSKDKRSCCDLMLWLPLPKDCLRPRPPYVYPFKAASIC